MQRLIPAFHSAAFIASPSDLYASAQNAHTDEQREAVEDYAADLATILALPTIEPVRSLPWPSA